MYSTFANSETPQGPETGVAATLYGNDAEPHSTGISLVKRTPYATEEVWKCMQATITRLYQSEGKSLREVMAIMERDHFLFATERMFKSRIVRWGLDKKLKEQEVLHMLELKRKRQATGKDSRFSIEDQDVDWNRVEQYLKRRPDLENKRQKQHAPSKSTTVKRKITCRTPSPAPSPVLTTETPGIFIVPVPSLLTPTLEVERQEDIMRIFSAYHTSAFQTGLWVLDDAHLCEHDFIHVVQTLTEIGKVPGLLKLNQTEAGLRTLRRALGSLRHVLRIREPRFYYSMLVNILTLRGTVLEYSIRCIHCIHREILGDQHPLSIVWGKLGDLPPNIRLETLRNIFAIICLHFEDENHRAYKSEHALDVLIMRCSLLRLLGNVGGDEFLAVIAGYTAAATEALQQGNYELSCRILLGVATALLDAGDFAQAERALLQIGATIQVRSGIAGACATTSLGPQVRVLESQQEDRCATSPLCSRASRYGQGARETKIIYGYYKGHWEPWSRWSPSVVRKVLDTHRQARETDVLAARLWADVLLSVR
ncbi:hypothetical protein CORC01_11905 [Colletotrichum orchidophilum]|uniref:Clr5 domain-containing protein n=1 Tax=Colletotrichum orchidophilum TaxID=1209926 RepID=A0A1G4AUI4_9PEZI|nr:uncharacterized protein CORC01_11905 [Colletotrichum orchidophilum]OHE92827.1 hypothetical protein CORC01_11905 [Colletotrichum orchidophilum]